MAYFIVSEIGFKLGVSMEAVEENWESFCAGGKGTGIESIAEAFTYSIVED